MGLFCDGSACLTVGTSPRGRDELRRAVRACTLTCDSINLPAGNRNRFGRSEGAITESSRRASTARLFSICSGLITKIMLNRIIEQRAFAKCFIGHKGFLS